MELQNNAEKKKMNQREKKTVIYKCANFDFCDFWEGFNPQVVSY